MTMSRRRSISHEIRNRNSSVGNTSQPSPNGEIIRGVAPSPTDVFYVFSQIPRAVKFKFHLLRRCTVKLGAGFHQYEFGNSIRFCIWCWRDHPPGLWYSKKGGVACSCLYQYGDQWLLAQQTWPPRRLWRPMTLGTHPSIKCHLSQRLLIVSGMSRPRSKPDHRCVKRFRGLPRWQDSDAFLVERDAFRQPSLKAISMWTREDRPLPSR